MVNNFWQLLRFKLLQGQDDYLEANYRSFGQQIMPCWPALKLIFSNDYTLIVQSAFAWALLSALSGNRASKYIFANVEN